MNGIPSIAHRKRLKRRPADTSGGGLELARQIIRPSNGLLGEAVVGIVAGLVVVPDERGRLADG